MIPFNKPYLTGKETHYICQAVSSGKISGNGIFTQQCHRFFEEHYHFKKCLLTTSCTDALEMAAILCDVGAGDEVIVPSYTFVSSALAFVRQGATVIFADSCGDNPNMDASLLEGLITERTKVIIPVHYAGVACDMGKIMEIANCHNILVVEDAAQAIDSFYEGKPLGGIGHLGCFSFHETKNIIAGEGGMLTINDDRFLERAEVIWEKGTNRSKFFRGEIDKYGWVDTGSSFLPSEITSAFLYAQLENLSAIQQRRLSLWEQYYVGLEDLAAKGFVTLPRIPSYATNNAHMFYIICRSLAERSALIECLKQHDILSVFHYQSLHRSQYYRQRHQDQNRTLAASDRYTDSLLRLPMYYELTEEHIKQIIEIIHSFFGIRKDKFLSRQTKSEYR